MTNSKTSEQVAFNIYLDYAKGISIRQIHKKYNISYARARNICRLNYHIMYFNAFALKYPTEADIIASKVT